MKIRRLYDILTLLYSALLVSLLAVTAFTYQTDQLTWHFPAWFGAAFVIDLIALWQIAKARFIYLGNPDKLLEVYHDRIVLLNRKIVISLREITDIHLKTYRAVAGTGSMHIRVVNNNCFTIRDIESIGKLESLLSGLLYRACPKRC